MDSSPLVCCATNTYGQFTFTVKAPVMTPALMKL
jgi:hypothetical protein